MSSGLLAVDVFVTPIRLYVGAASQEPGDEPTWAPRRVRLLVALLGHVVV